MIVRMWGSLASTAAPSGVTSTSTGPRLESSAMSGVVRMTSPRKLVWMTSDPLTPRRPPAMASIHLQDGEKRLLRYFHGPHLLHALLPLLLLLQKLALAADVAPVTLGQHVLAQRFHARPRDDLRSDRRLDRHLEELARNEILQLVGDLASPFVGLVPVYDDAER